MLTRSLGYEWATEGVRVVAVSPGYMRTPFVEGAISRGELDPTVLDGTVPRGTMASPEEIAAVVVAVAGPDFGFVTGEVITADGGGSLGWPARGRLIARGRRPRTTARPRSGDRMPGGRACPPLIECRRVAVV